MVITFGDDPDHGLDPGNFKRIFIIIPIYNIGDVVPWKRYAL